MSMNQRFDAVIMLTWSDWETEPRSNRYHYASRFARLLPVLFLQHRYASRIDIQVKGSEIDNLDIVNVNCGLTARDVNEIRQLLSARGIKRPLLWIYDSLHYQQLIDALPGAFLVYHATEDYLTRTEGWNNGWSDGKDEVASSVVRMLDQVDFMVACSEGVANSYLTSGRYAGSYVVVENGCDAEYFLELGERHAVAWSALDTPVAIFQGGINQRLDYALMFELIRNMPDWEFRFCGAAVDSEPWSRILKLRNVRYLKELQPEQFGRQMLESTVGMITYIQDQWIRNSLPLKAYEYVACGLPVVTVPITALERDADLIATATTAVEFEAAMRRAVPLRLDPASLRRRREVALTKSYNARFAAMAASLLSAAQAPRKAQTQLKIAMLYDNLRSLHVSTIREHLDAFDKYSRHAVTYVPATPDFWNAPPEAVVAQVDFSCFDVLVVHYSVRVSIMEHLDEGLARALEASNRFKVLFLQDEYENTETARRWMERLKFDVVYTCVPTDGLEVVYPAYRFPGTEFLPTLTGYVPEGGSLESYAKPLRQRDLLIGYRGRKLPAVYGQLGYEKYRIGTQMRAIAEQRGLPVDIEVDDSKRIYGVAWYEFLGTARATLGTESGANIFDLDGSLKVKVQRLEEANPGITFDEIADRLFGEYEGRVRMNQISPKIFESIRVRTALILFEGSYSGIVRPHEHFIPLKKDFSNIDEVLAKLADLDYLEAMTERAYRDVVLSGKYAYAEFIKGFDADIEQRVLRGGTPHALIQAVYFVARDGSKRQALPPLPPGIFSGQLAYPVVTFTAVPTVSVSVEGVTPSTLSSPLSVPVPSANKGLASPGYQRLRRIWRLLPIAVRLRIVRTARSALYWKHSPAQRGTLLFRIVRGGWHLLPYVARIRLARLIERS